MTRTDSLGEIIDKLITNCIKQYMQEEKRHHGSASARLAASDKITQLNKKRWKLIGAINEIIDPEHQPEHKYY